MKARYDPENVFNGNFPIPPDRERASDPLPAGQKLDGEVLVGPAAQEL